jgi:ribosomal protein L37AE/L43A
MKPRKVMEFSDTNELVYTEEQFEALQKRVDELKAKTKCNCPENIKTGSTTVWCCNICGYPDDNAWSLNTEINVKE